MAENMNDIIQVAVDAYHGNVTKYSVGQSMQLLRDAAVELNGGSTKLNYKNIRDGKCNGLFTLIEEILSRTVVEGLQNSDFFMNFVDFRNVAAGDQNVFVTEDSDLFVVSEVADGTQAIRRQRLGGYNEVSIPTTVKAVKIYDEMNRMLAGQIDFNKMISKVGDSVTQKLLNDIYTLWISATADQLGGNAFFPTAGAYDEDALLETIAHVEAAAGGKPATILGTKPALRNLAPSIQGAESKHDLYTAGFYGNFYGSPVVAIPQRHKVNSTDFVFDDKVLTIVAGDTKPVKVVYEGQSTIIMGQPADNQDLTQTYLYMERYGMGLVLAGGNAGIGRYQMT